MVHQLSYLKIVLFAGLIASLSGCAIFRFASGAPDMQELESKVGAATRAAAESYDKAVALKKEGNFPEMLSQFHQEAQACAIDMEKNMAQAKMSAEGGHFKMSDYLNQDYATSTGNMKPQQLQTECQKMAAFEGLPAQIPSCSKALLVVLWYNDTSAPVFASFRPIVETPATYSDGQALPSGLAGKCADMPKKTELHSDFSPYAARIARHCKGGVVKAITKSWQQGVDDRPHPDRPYKYLEMQCWRNESKSPAEWARIK